MVGLVATLLYPLTYLPIPSDLVYVGSHLSPCFIPFSLMFSSCTYYIFFWLSRPGWVEGRFGSFLSGEPKGKKAFSCMLKGVAAIESMELPMKYDPYLSCIISPRRHLDSFCLHLHRFSRSFWHVPSSPLVSESPHGFHSLVVAKSGHRSISTFGRASRRIALRIGLPLQYPRTLDSPTLPNRDHDDGRAAKTPAGRGHCI